MCHPLNLALRRELAHCFLALYRYSFPGIIEATFQSQSMPVINGNPFHERYCFFIFCFKQYYSAGKKHPKPGFTGWIISKDLQYFPHISKC